MSEEAVLTNIPREQVVSKKKLAASSVFVFLFCVAAGCSILYYRGPQMNAVHLATYLFLGAVYAAITLKNKSAQTASAGFIAAFLGAVLISGLFCLFAYLRLHIPASRVVSFGAAFLLPVILYQSWRQFVSIPAVPVPLWYFTNDLPPAPGMVFFENTPVTVKVIAADGTVSKFSAVSPVQVKLGIAFYRLVQEKNKGGRAHIEFSDDKGAPYGWTFYESRFGLWKKSLDPNETIYENGIKPKTVIVAECRQN